MNINNETPLPLVMSVEQAANYLGVCRATAYNWCIQGILPSFKVANTRRIRRESLEKWLEQHEQGSVNVKAEV